MKKLILTAITIIAISETSFARRGEHDADPGRDDGNTISCKDAAGTSVLQFSSTQLQGQVATDIFDLTVKARGTDVGEVSLTDKRSDDSVKVKRLEETLKVTLLAGEAGSAPVVVESSTHRGYGEAVVRDIASGDYATVQSLSRRGVSRMSVSLVTDEEPNKALTIVCEKIR